MLHKSSALLLALFLTEGLFRGASGDTPVFWLTVIVAIVAGALPLFPLQLWRVRRGRSAWVTHQIVAVMPKPSSGGLPAIP